MNIRNKHKLENKYSLISQRQLDETSPPKSTVKDMLHKFVKFVKHKSMKFLKQTINLKISENKKRIQAKFQ